MKTIILFLALATALFGQASAGQGRQIGDMYQPAPATTEKLLGLAAGTPPSKPSDFVMATSPTATFTLTAKYDILWMDTHTLERLLCVDGISEVIPIVPAYGEGSTSHVFISKQQKRPEKPEEITIELWTADGKKWVAKWEEAKP